MSAPIRIAVVGAGLIGGKHIARIHAHPDYELAGIAEVEADAARLNHPGTPVHADYRHLLDTVRPDAVLIASPNQAHAEQGVECARRGLPFIIEKPVTATLDSAAELCAAVRAAGVPTLVGHHRRQHPPVREARRLIRDGAIGDIVGVSGVWATFKPAPYFAAGAWRTLKGGGVILINLIHEIDLMRFCLGEITSVVAVASNRRRGFAVEDTAAMVLSFASGALGTFLLSDCAVSPWTMEQGLGESPEFPFSGESGYRFIGARGSLEFPELRLWSQTAEQPDWNRPVVSRMAFADRADPYAAQLSHFRDVIRGAATSVQTVEDGARTLAAALAVSEAAETGRPVAIGDRLAAFGWTGGC